MDSKKRKYGLQIWGLALGYFSFYTPYSGLTKAISKGWLPGMKGPVSGFELLPVTVMATVVSMLGFITLMGWWRYAGHREFFGLSLPVPGRWTFLSGLCMATIIGTTTLAFTFSGVSVVFMLVLLRGGVLIIAPIVDALLKRRVRWFSWTAMIVSCGALLVALGDVDGYTMTVVAALDVAAYLTAYFFRFQYMTRLAKTEDRNTTLRYFVEEQIIATPALLMALALLAAIGKGDTMMELRHGFTTFFGSQMVGPAFLVGLCYAGLCVCTTFIFLDRRENMFCIPMHCGSSMLSGVAASYALTFFFNQAPPSTPQLLSAGLIIIALLFLSPLHHVQLYLGTLKKAFGEGRLMPMDFVTGLTNRVRETATPTIPRTSVAESIREDNKERRAPAYLEPLRRVFLFVCSGNTARSPLAQAICNAEIAARLNIALEALGQSHVQALSAGVSVEPGAPMTLQAQQTLRQFGVPVSPHASRALTLELVQQADVIYCMTQSHRRAVISMVPSAADKTKCLDPDADIDDPAGAGAEVYARCARRIQSLIRQRLDEAGITADLFRVNQLGGETECV
jgi:protein-tyrosine-phosphatase